MENTHTHTHRKTKYCNPRACAPRVNEKHSSVNPPRKIVTFGLKTPLHALSEHTGLKTELYETNVQSHGFIYKATF